MKSNTLTLILVGIIIVLAYLQTRSCRQLPSNVVDKARQDSMMKKVADSSRRLQATLDSLVIRKKDHVIDSLVPLANAAKQKVNDKGRQVVGIAAAVQEAKERHDTAAYVSNCDSLTREIDIAAHLVGGYEYLTDSLISALQEQRKIQDSINQVHVARERLLQVALDSSDNRYQRLDTKYSKVLRRANKRWSVGPGGGGTYLGGKVRPVLDISVHYDLFRF